MPVTVTSQPSATLDHAVTILAERSRTQPAAVVAGVEAAARVHHTPCGDGAVVWRSWGGDPGDTQNQKPILVLIHGGHGSWTHWLLTIPALARDFRVLAPDMPGFGDSALLTRTPEADDLAKPLVAGLEAIVPESAEIRVAAFSFGAVISGYVAKRLGARATGLVFIGASGLGLPREIQPALRRWRDAATDAEMKAAHRENLAALMIGDPERIDELAIHLQQVNTARARVQSRPISRTGLLRDVLPDITARYAAIYGAWDVTALPDVHARAPVLRQAQGRAPFHVIDGSGHWVLYEAPGETVSMLREFLGPWD